MPTKPKQVASERELNLKVKIWSRYAEWLKSMKKADGRAVRTAFSQIASDEFDEPVLRIQELLKEYR